MTDLEMTRLCAEAMGLYGDETTGWPIGNTPWNPLHDDAQAMALVKRFRLELGTFENSTTWAVCLETGNANDQVTNHDLNRAICECVAKVQIAKVKP